jgi:hypothetical protein
MARIPLSDLQDALLFVGSQPIGTNSAYIARDTGEIHWHSDQLDLDDDDLPEDLDSDHHVEMPHPDELGLGKPLVLRFAAETVPHSVEHVDACFRRRGAYGRIKDLFASRGVLEKWYAYEQDATDETLRKWCAEVELEIEDAPPRTAAPETHQSDAEAP